MRNSSSSHLKHIPDERLFRMNQTSRTFSRNGEVSSARADIQRWGALIGGGALAVLGLKRRSATGVAMALAGGTLAYLGATSATPRRDPVVKSSVLVNASSEEVYGFWRDFENLPLFMRHLDSVRVSPEGRITFVAVGPMGTQIVWDAEIINDVPNESLSWSSLPGSDLAVDCSVTIRQAPSNRGVVVAVVMSYRPRSGRVGRTIAQFLAAYPSFWIKQDLRRFKAFIETGELPTIQGQTHGPRSAKIAALRLADPDLPIHSDSRITEVFNALRRIA